MDELTIGDKTYVSSKRAAKITGYATDYVGQLCREGRVEARLVGRNWYVLEAAIREHRFGAPAEKKGSTDEATASKRNESEQSIWQPSYYAPETPALVPELIPKATVPVASAVQSDAESQKVVTDMQNAWQEWFTTPRQALPDGNEMLDEALLPAVIEEESVLEATIEPVEEVKAVLPPEEEPVLLSRLDRPIIEESPEEEIIVHRSRESFSTGEEVPPQSSVVDLAHRTPVAKKERPARSQAGKREWQNSRGGTVVLKAVLLSIAGLAVVVTFIGSGYAEGSVRGRGVQSAIVHFFDGTRIIDKESK